MKDKIIKNYINNLSLTDIENFSKKHDIQLTKDECLYLQNLIRNEWHNIIYGDPHSIFQELKIIFNKNKYNKLYQLYQNYKSKYSHYL